MAGNSGEDESRDPGLSLYPLNPGIQQIQEDQALEEQEEEQRLEQEVQTPTFSLTFSTFLELNFSL